MTLKEKINVLEKQEVLKTLRQSEGNITKASNLLGVSRGTLYNLMNKHSVSLLINRVVIEKIKELR